MKKSLLRWGTLICILLFSYTGISQIKNTFDVRYENRLKGDITFIANNIVNRDTSSEDPEDPYNLTGSSSEYNDRLNMQYIDIDGDPSTFSSSSATLAVPDPSCSQIRYAGLYWSAVYTDSDRSDFDQVKFRVPGGSYMDLTADEILFDGYNDGDFGYYAPYACYKDVTSIVTGLTNPEGDYFVGNVRASSGSSIQGGVSGGWTMVVVYENPTYPGKFITTFDGYAGVKSGETVDIPFSGFTTLPPPFPVRAKLGVATLEGDNRITGDQLAFKADSNSSFTTLSNSANPSNNFFNSNITNEGSIVTTRNPNSENTLGWDVDMFTIPNPSNSVIPNDETGATFRASSTQDKYDIFFTSMDVEIIEPKINLAKTVEDIAGNDITGLGVNLGQYLDYVLTFENVGNDDAVGYTIRDVLPINVTLDESSITMPTGTTYTFDPATRTIIFTIPDSIVEEDDPAATIRMRVQVAENCFDFIDACTDIIENLAYSTYSGAINSASITDDPSVYDFDGCGFAYPGATNFLLDDLEACNFTRTVQLCGENVLLDAGDNFDNYIWYRDENGNNTIDIGTDTVITDSDSDNDPSTILVDETGTYIVDKQVADPCKDFAEIIVVELFGETQSNPITALINDTSNTIDGDILVCPNDGSELPEIFLCGLNDTELIQINIPDAQSIVWEKLDEASCTEATDGCANTNASCTWNTVDTGNDFLASDSGQYRLVINYQNGCFSRFYFNIYKNPLDPQYTSRDIICNTPGNITVTNMPLSYEYQLVDQTTGNVLVPYGPSPSFDITTNGAYMVEMRQEGVTDGCVFVLDNIGILERDFQVDITAQNTSCNDLGAISISVLDVEPQYYYTISQGGVEVDTHGPSTDNNYTFENLNAGIYDVNVSTDDGCAYTEQVTILDESNLELTARISQHITCKEGNIIMDSKGGKTPHVYAIWSFVDRNGVTQISYPSVADIPASEFQTEQIFDVVGAAGAGTYTYVVVDRNNCYDISNPVTIEFRPAAEYNATSVMDVSCYGESTGTITFNLVDDNGYQLTYYLFDATGFDEENYDFANALATNSSGNFPGLTSGDYVVVINQRKGSAACDYYEYHSIDAPAAALDLDAVIVQEYSCLQDGIIEAQNVTGGAAPYEYSIDGVTFDSSPTFSNLTDGTYTVTVRDANGCTFSDAITIAPLDPPTDLVFNSTVPGCPDQTSDVTVTVAGGTAAFVYEIIAPSPIAPNTTSGDTATFSGLDPDTYTFRVTDATGCEYTESYTIAPTTPIGVVGQAMANISCIDAEDGEALFTVSGFNTSYDYTISGPSAYSNTGTAETNSSISISNLEDGTYTITVTDNETNCTDTATVTIDAPPSPIDATPAIEQPTCIVDGSVNITATGGWEGYTYEIISGPTGYTPPAPQSNGLFGNLAIGGDYTFKVTDANGCEFTDIFTINEAVEPVLEIVPNDICYDDATGLTLTANVTDGGDGNFEYSLNGGPFGTNNVFTGLAPGDYTIEVRDGNDCTDTASITIDPELSVVASAPNITACGTDTDITITAAGGDGNYVYAVVADGATPADTDFAPTNPITVTSAGDYDVYVRDNGGASGYCEATYDITITQDDSLALTPNITNVSCNGGSDGSIVLNVTGGEAPYMYSIDNGTTYQTSNTFINLPAGTYDISVTDANNCPVTTQVTITEPDPIVAEAEITQDYTCTQLGEITVGSITPTSGGSGNFEYSLNGGTWTTSTVFAGLEDGSYSIRVRDANVIDCFITLPEIIIPPLPVEPTLSTTVTYNCDGTAEVTVLPLDASYTYSLNGGTPQIGNNVFSGVASGTHTIEVDYGSECTVTTSVNVEPGYAFNGAITAHTDITCNGDADGTITFEAENFDSGLGFEYEIDNSGVFTTSTTSPVTITGLAAGTHTINIRDLRDAACSVVLSQTLTQPDVVDVSASVTTELTCTNGGATITATATGGTPAYQYQLEDTSGTPIVTYQSSNSFSGLAAGDYVVRVQDANMCEDTTPVTVDPAEIIAFDVTPTLCYSGNNDGSIQVDVTSGNGNYQFSINGGAWITPSPSTDTTYTFENLTAGTYTIDVRDGYGCTATDTAIINPALSASAFLDSDLTCLDDATITITANGGTGTYSYEWSNDGGTTYNSTGFTGNVFNTSTDGTYTFLVTDTAGCTTTTNSIVVTPASQPVISSVTPTDILCNGESTGVLDVVIDTSVGVPPYTINVFETISGTDYGTQTTGLPAGNYEVTVTDSKGCVSDPYPVVISEPTPISSNVTHTNLTCAATGTELGTITVDASGGTPTYIYEVFNNDHSVNLTYDTSAGTNDHTFTGLDFGDYTLVVTDSNGCQDISTVTITTGPDVLITTQATAGCTPGSGEMLVEADALNGTLGTGTFYFALYPAPTFNASDPAWFPEDASPAPDNSHLFTGLTPGVTYTFIVYDEDTECEYLQEATVPVSTTSSLDSSIDTVTDITCTGAADGSVDFTVWDYVGTNVNYEIFYYTTNTATGITGTISGTVGGPETDTATGLSPGEYYILYEDENGCVSASDSFVIQQSPTLLEVIAESPTNDNCTPNAGVITANAQFGTAPYEYLYLPALDPAPTASTTGWTSSTTANVEAGDYIVYVKDANDCIQSDPVTVLLDPSPEISIAVVDECVDEGLFEVMVTLDNPADAMAPFQISVNGAAFQNFTFDGSNQYLISGLSSGDNQTIEVRDLNGCIDSETFDIHPPLEFNVIQTVALDCESGTNAYAELEIEVISGSGNYEFIIDGPGTAYDMPQSTLTLDASNKFVWDGAGAAGSYDVIVFDMGTAPPNCPKTVTIDVPEAPYPSFTYTYTDVTCNDADDGTISVQAIDNGIGPYTFQIIAASDASISTPIAPTNSTATTATFTNLEGSTTGITYDIQVTAANNCADIETVTITEPEPIDNIDVDVVEFVCAVGNNSNNASITVDTASITGGSGNYVTYEFINDAGSVVVQSGSNPTYIETDTNGGNYTINVYDDNGCLGTTTAVIAPYDQITDAVAAITNPLSCTPGMDGEITINVTSTLGDPSRFEYSIDNGATWEISNVFGGLDAGTHNFLVRHIDTGCVVSTSETITDPNTFDIDLNVVSNIICYGTATGEVTFELVDATYAGGFNWTIYNTNGTPVDTSDDLPVHSDNSTTTGPETYSGLATGSYRLVISQDVFPECTNEEAFNIAGPNAAISGSRTVTDITCVEDGIIEVTASGGWGGYAYYVSTTPNPDPNNTSSYLPTPKFENLTAGTYEVWIIDQEGCALQLPDVELSVPDPITATLQVNQSNCVDLQGEIQVVGTSGGQGSNYSYLLIKDGSNFGSPQSSTIFSGLGAGSYTVEITDQWGCSVILPGTVELTNAMTANATVDKTIDCTMNPGGQITINVTGGSSNLEYRVEDPLGNITIDADADGIFTGLTEPGEYIFTVTDLDTSEPCTYEVRQTLDDKVDPVLEDATIVDVSCAGGSDGSILVNLDPATALNPPYQYALVGLSAGAPDRSLQDSPLFENLPEGDYQVRVVSERECEAVKTETVGEPDPLGATATTTQLACDTNNGTQQAEIEVTIDPTSGTPNYFYSVNGGTFMPTGGNVFTYYTSVADDYNIVIRDSNGCTFALPTQTIDPLPQMDLTIANVVDISCANSGEEITVIASGQSSPNDLTFEVLETGDIQTVSTDRYTFTLPNHGNYTIQVTDNGTGCYEFITHTVEPYDLIDVTATATSPAVCFDDAGELTIDVTGYTGAYYYEVFRNDGTLIVSGNDNTSTGSVPITHPALVGGNYYVEVEATEAPFCTDTSGSVTIKSPSSELEVTPEQVASVTCTDDMGEVLIAPTGGYAPYDIVLTNITTTQSYTMNDVHSYVFTGLSAGSYEVSVTDSEGCEIIDNTSLILDPVDPITADIDAAPIDLLCFGDESASVWAHNVAGGEGSYNYQLNYYDETGTNIVFTSGEQGSPRFNNLGAGTYSITVTDGWNCSFTTDPVTITEPSEVMASLVQLSGMTCNDDAQLELTASGGTAPYFYSADGVTFNPMSGGDTHTFNVGAGTYQYYMRDANGCDAMISNQVTVDEVPELMLEIDESAAIINCMGEASATIIAQATGGLGNYSYELFSDAALTNLVDGPQTNGTFNSLMAGDYYVRVTSEDCVEVSPVITIVDPEPLVVDREEFTNITCSGMNDGTITVEVSGGTGEIQYAISPNLDQFDTTNTFTDLEPGIYDVIAQDANGCFITFQFELTQPEPVVAEAINIMDEVCFESGDGSFEIQISGGTAPYQTSLNSSADANFVQDQVLFQDLPAGTHVVFVRDAQGCETNVIVEIDPGVNLAATVTPVYECTENIPDNYLDIVLEDESIAGDLMYALDSTDPADMQLSADFTNMTPGDHYITIAHANGCMTTYDFTIETFEPLVLSLENTTINQITAIAEGGVEDYTFYFNGIDNGTDNTFFINRTDTYTVTVVDQNGCEATAEIFMEFIDIEFPNFFTPDGDGRNDIWIPDNIEGFPDVLIKIYDRYGRVVEEMTRNVKGWDGNYDGKPLPTGDYWYVVKLEGEQDFREFVGHFTLYRE
ncbi:conserved repeat domain protein [Allomuricauda ruestringensis DSM 13258]|uniref:Conserved repeat domain protein n=1 Tax=Allomuricauda ruestringensis (strain DSM 13258 / CIP 107369 / LMG 19739 / B1) TaxID=886377 RepID=G2PPB0_ALLRU|nr:T9SS type B sorting domain-containing protein [Allomuricauda ruestringensis]AEM70362.1 conserved repeat domain protein [Allomuricauda ruestringensis DSM 13258]